MARAVFDEDEYAVINERTGKVRHASPGAWRFLGWRLHDPDLGRLRLLPVETFGSLAS